jgi:hypothetical protein
MKSLELSTRSDQALPDGRKGSESGSAGMADTAGIAILAAAVTS